MQTTTTTTTTTTTMLRQTAATAAAARTMLPVHPSLRLRTRVRGCVRGCWQPSSASAPKSWSWSSVSTSSFSTTAASASSPDADNTYVDEATRKRERARFNATTAGLYRLLLRECRQIAIDANNNAGSNISSSNKSDKDVLEGNLLLQPPVDTEEFGRIRPLFRNSNSNNDSTSKSSNNSENSGGDGSDNKQVPNHANLPSFVDHTVSAVSESATTNETADAADDRAAWSAIAFFTTRLPKRTPLEPPTANVSAIAKNNAADFHINKGWMAVHQQLNSQSSPYAMYQYHLVTPSQLVHAARSAFIRSKRIRPSTTPQTVTAEDWAKAKARVVSLQRMAIDAARVLAGQQNLMDCTSISFDEQRGVRIVATSKYKSRGLLSRGAGMMQQEEHVFVYRIRIEYCNNAGSGKPIQLLGRRWRITDGSDDEMMDGIPGDGLDDDHDEPDVQVVNAPRTGVVGYHPILQPGDAFEYTSGCNLASSVGSMSGGFYFCELDGDDVNTDNFLARIGDELPAFKYEDWNDEGEENKEEESGGVDLNSKSNNEARFFECAVAPFLLDASKLS